MMSSQKAEYLAALHLAVTNNAVIEGDEATLDASTATVRLSNSSQIMDKTVVITGTQESVDKAGRASEIAYQIAKKAKELKINEAILDLGLHPSRKGTILYSVLKGVVDSGLNVAHSPEIFPSDDRIMGKHISDKIPVEFEKVKNNIMQGGKK